MTEKNFELDWEDVKIKLNIANELNKLFNGEFDKRPFALIFNDQKNPILSNEDLKVARKDLGDTFSLRNISKSSLKYLNMYFGQKKKDFSLSDSFFKRFEDACSLSNPNYFIEENYALLLCVEIGHNYLGEKIIEPIINIEFLNSLADPVNGKKLIDFFANNDFTPLELNFLVGNLIAPDVLCGFLEPKVFKDFLIEFEKQAIKNKLLSKNNEYVFDEKRASYSIISLKNLGNYHFFSQKFKYDNMVEILNNSQIKSSFYMKIAKEFYGASKTAKAKKIEFSFDDRDFKKYTFNFGLPKSRNGSLMEAIRFINNKSLEELNGGLFFDLNSTLNISKPYVDFFLSIKIDKKYINEETVTKLTSIIEELFILDNTSFKSQIKNADKYLPETLRFFNDLIGNKKNNKNKM